MFFVLYVTSRFIAPVFVSPFQGLFLWKKNKDKPETPCKYKVSRFVLIITYGLSFATRAIENNMQPKTLQRILGHSKLELTMNLYVHSTKEKQREDMDLLEGVFSVPKICNLV